MWSSAMFGPVETRIHSDFSVFQSVKTQAKHSLARGARTTMHASGVIRRFSGGNRDLA